LDGKVAHTRNLYGANEDVQKQLQVVKVARRYVYPIRPHHPPVSEQLPCWVIFNRLAKFESISLLPVRDYAVQFTDEPDGLLDYCDDTEVFHVVLDLVDLGGTKYLNSMPSHVNDKQRSRQHIKTTSEIRLIPFLHDDVPHQIMHIEYKSQERQKKHHRTSRNNHTLIILR
jgi:hypothetical protein